MRECETSAGVASHRDPSISRLCPDWADSDLNTATLSSTECERHRSNATTNLYGNICSYLGHGSNHLRLDIVTKMLRKHFSDSALFGYETLRKTTENYATLRDDCYIQSRPVRYTSLGQALAKATQINVNTTLPHSRGNLEIL